jgi:hypothetical protein
MTWMHMMDGNASKEGLSKDLQNLADGGVGGALIFSISRRIPAGNVSFNSQAFRDIVVHGAQEAEKLGLTIGVHNCDGWTSSGGPWVPVEESMKRVVWSETVVEGGALDLELPQPRTMHDFYHDIAVVAYPAKKGDRELSLTAPTLSASGGQAIENLRDQRIETTFNLEPANEGEKPWIQLSYKQPFTAQSIYLEHWTRNAYNATLLSSEDGNTFTPVKKLKVRRTGKRAWIFQDSLQPTTARYFRIEFNMPLELVYLELEPSKRLPSWQGQTAILHVKSSNLDSLNPARTGPPIPLDNIHVLEAKNGHLKTKLPPGEWRIFRFGYTTIGAMNSPATDAGRGFECDKFSSEALDHHFAAYVGKIAAACGELAGKSFRFSEIDSYEMGGQNWTEGFAEQFKASKGYDLIPFLPLFAGRYIENPETTRAVLSDFRKLTGELMVENYYKRFTELCHEHGMLSYIENYGFGPTDNLTIGGHTDIPMGEFWIDTRPATHYISPISAAHTYGKPVISAEAFTSYMTPNWGMHPYLIKHIGDYAWTMGINEFMFHRYAHQANPNVVPGMTMDEVGSHIDGTQTWWLNAGKAWMKYIQRGSYLLRQGVPVADILLYVGEGSPQNVVRFESVKPRIPRSYKFDYCDTEVLMNRLSVKDGRLVLPEGTSYRVLRIDHSERMSLKTLQRIGELAEAGATIVADKPVGPKGYFEQQHKTAEFNVLANRIWSQNSILPLSEWKPVFEKLNLEPDCIIQGNPQATFMHRKVDDADIYFIQNKDETAQTVTASFRVTDRIPELWFPDTGKIKIQGQFTHADGRTELPIRFDPRGAAFVVFRKPSQSVDPILSIAPTQASVLLNSDNQLELHSQHSGSFKLVHASGKKQHIEIPTLGKPIQLDRDWRAAFNGPGLADPKTIDFKTLTDWKDHAREDIRHFSGSATYQKKIEVPADWMQKGNGIILDLGTVEIAAEIWLNGKSLGTLWKPPFKVDITEQLKPGANELKIRVTNLWVNRLIGDEQLERTDGYIKGADNMPDWYLNNQPMPEGPRSTFTTYNFYEEDQTLRPSGLIGPVSINQEARILVP